MAQPTTARLAARWRQIREILSIKEESKGSYDSLTWVPADDTGLVDGNRLWAQYAVFVDLYKHYLDIIWKTSVWYYGVTGAILTYYFANASSELPGPLPLVLGFLSVFSLALALLHVKGGSDLMTLKGLLEDIALDLGLPGRPHVEFAVDFVILNAVLMSLVSVATAILFFAGLSEFECCS